MHIVWINGQVVRMLDLRLAGRGFQSWPPSIECNPVTKQYNLVQVVLPCGWEGNRRSGVTLAMHHRH